MPIAAVQQTNWTKAVHVDFQNVSEINHALAVVDGSNYLGSLGTIGRKGNWRVDRQSPSSTHINIQVQRDGIGNPSTGAIVLIPKNYSGKLGNVQDKQGPGHARLQELTKYIRQGLKLSAESHRENPQKKGEYQIRVFEIVGSFSS